QAEDGIRDKLVTGVQTCALPISNDLPTLGSREVGVNLKGSFRWVRTGAASLLRRAAGMVPLTVFTQVAVCLRALLFLTQLYRLRSEERRVGKEVRYWWWRVLQIR